MDRLSTQHAPLIVALVVCLLLSWLSAKIGMAAIIGAFFAGLMFADYAPQWNLLPRVGGITEFWRRTSSFPSDRNWMCTFSVGTC
jgi:Kef-type K+ transport system membrane component KefB